MFKLFKGLGAPKAEGVEYVNAQDAKGKIDAGEYKKVLDVRTPAEFHTAHLPGSENSPVSNLNNGVKELEPLKEEKILLYCNTQNSSTMAAKYLKNLGFTDITVMLGGIKEWYGKGYEIATQQ